MKMYTNDHIPVSPYTPGRDRYKKQLYRTCGNSGLQLPSISLGLWHNFGDTADLHNARLILREAFDCGITHFDLANNYGPPYGSAESNFGTFLKKDFQQYRDELIISTKAGYDMWDGPYGRGGSKKYIISSCNASLKRMGLDYVDIFYHHCPDPDTPMEETAEALASLVLQGKALYIGISNRYDAPSAGKAVTLLKERGIPLLVNQVRCSLLDRRALELCESAADYGYGIMPFSPLEQGILAGKYLEDIPEKSRLSDSTSYLPDDDQTKRKIEQSKKLNLIARKRGQTLAQLSISWLLNNPRICSVLVGASTPEQVRENIKAASYPPFSSEELESIDLLCNQ